MFKIIFFLIFLISNLATSQTRITFPNVMLKGEAIEIKVESSDSLENIKINGKIVTLQKINDHYSGKIALKNNTITLPKNTTSNTPIIISGWLSLLPPLIAILLALLLKEVLVSLFIGVFIGAAVIGVYTKSFIGIFTAFYTVLDHYILDTLADKSHLSVILFSLLIGSTVAVISKNGGMQGVVNRIIKFATTRKSGMLSTYFLGIAIFFDDYANTLVVGNTMRSVSDKLKISREKLAYIVDSTAAPIAAVAFITTWIGAELTYISDGVEKIEAAGGEINESAYSIFVSSLGYSFYPIFTLIFMFFLLYKQKDYGPMLKFEKDAIKNGVDVGDDNDESSVDLKEFDPINENKTYAFNAVIPILTVVLGTIIGLIYTGLDTTLSSIFEINTNFNGSTWNGIELIDANATGFFRKLGIVIGNADSYAALLWSSMTGLLVAILLTVSQKIMNLSDTMESVITGIKTMLPAIAILILAWSLAGVTEDLNTAEFLKGFFDGEFENIWIIPALTFIFSAVIAFSTGSSWSTMALMYPLVIPLAYGVASGNASYDETAILYNVIASVLAGSVLGDHCSPISDTTILSSLASGCIHINHVKSQMPYALTVGGVALLVGIIPGALGVSSFITIPIGIAILYLIVHFFGKEAEKSV